MIVYRTTLETDPSPADVAKLREACMGCKNCSGVCGDLIEMSRLPAILLGRRETRL